MSFLIVPHETESRRATVWVAVINETHPDDPSQPFDLHSLIFRYNGTDLSFATPWGNHTTESGRNTISYRYFELPDLEPRTDYIMELFRGNEVVATGSVRTLPDDVPFRDDIKGPFTLLLSSCFCASKPESSAIGNAYFHLSAQNKPDIKILCGDQVYLDAPFWRFVLSRHSFNELQDIHFTNYKDTWTQEGGPFGNKHFLQNGANFFCADDHEFWNNSPNDATAIFDSHFESGRTDWKNVALNLLQIFQGAKTTTEFNVGPLRFFIADTRIDRGPGKGNFMDPVNLQKLDNWIVNLSQAESGAVGVVVIGQPIFSDAAGRFSSAFLDKNLPNYKQYEDLAQVLGRTVRPLLVLTGDVHYGRLAQCQLSNGVSLYEVISSPSALVADLPFSGWSAPPELFPSFDIPGLPQMRTAVKDDYTLTDNHFLTLGFFREGAGISVTIKAFRIGSGLPSIPIEVKTFRIGDNI